MNEFGCSSCHSGRGRGTDFYSSVHMPSTLEQKKEWEEKYDWEKMHYWLEPMLPTKYIQASCFKCHNSQPMLEGGETLALGLQLIDKSGCNNCHVMENFPSTRKNGPPLTNLNNKVNKEWVAKWIKNPQSFRYNTWMPHFFNQDNNSSDDMIKRNDTEIFAITNYLFKNQEDTIVADYIDISESIENIDSLDVVNGKDLFNILGCRGCHTIEENSVALGNIEIPYNMLQSDYGYEPDTTGKSPEIMDRYSLPT